jgi:hypothetical protein
MESRGKREPCGRKKAVEASAPKRSGAASITSRDDDDTSVVRVVVLDDFTLFLFPSCTTFPLLVEKNGELTQNKNKKRALCVTSAIVCGAGNPSGRRFAFGQCTVREIEALKLIPRCSVVFVEQEHSIF